MKSNLNLTHKTQQIIEDLKTEAYTLTRLAAKMHIPKRRCAQLITRYNIPTVRAFGVIFIPKSAAHCLMRIHAVTSHASAHGIVKRITHRAFVNDAVCPVCLAYPIICGSPDCVCPNGHIFHFSDVVIRQKNVSIHP